MSRPSAFGIFAALLCVAAAFVVLSGSALPPLVASHFAASGTADRFMPRVAYLVFMVGATVGVPLVLVLSHGLLRFVPPRFINLPNREYWLAPERSAATVAFLRSHSVRFASLLVVFLCFVHWLVVKANTLQPPRLTVRSFIAGLLLFLVAAVVWLGALLGHFRRCP